MILTLALLNICVGIYLIWFALHSDHRDQERSVLATGVLLVVWALVVAVLSGRHGIPTGASEWWAGVTAPQATLIAALGVGVIGGFTILQKLRNDRRDQWWKRTQWAIDLTLVDDERSQIVGWAAIAELSTSEPATRQDRLLLRQVADAVLDDVVDAGDIDDTDEVVAEDGGDNEDSRDEDGHLAPDDRWEDDRGDYAHAARHGDHLQGLRSIQGTGGPNARVAGQAARREDACVHRAARQEGTAQEPQGLNP